MPGFWSAICRQCCSVLRMSVSRMAELTSVGNLRCPGCLGDRRAAGNQGLAKRGPDLDDMEAVQGAGLRYGLSELLGLDYWVWMAGLEIFRAWNTVPLSRSIPSRLLNLWLTLTEL